MASIMLAKLAERTAGSQRQYLIDPMVSAIVGPTSLESACNKGRREKANSTSMLKIVSRLHVTRLVLLVASRRTAAYLVPLCAATLTILLPLGGSAGGIAA
jgi:hypothetical protein